jgi:hypothetical protein
MGGTMSYPDDRHWETDDERVARDESIDDREARAQIARDTTAAHTPGLDSVRTPKEKKP